MKPIGCGQTSFLLKLYSFGKEIICKHNMGPVYVITYCWGDHMFFSMDIFENSNYLGKDKDWISLNLITASPQRHTSIQIKTVVILRQWHPLV